MGAAQWVSFHSGGNLSKSTNGIYLSLENSNLYVWHAIFNHNLRVFKLGSTGYGQPSQLILELGDTDKQYQCGDNKIKKDAFYVFL